MLNVDLILSSVLPAFIFTTPCHLADHSFTVPMSEERVSSYPGARQGRVRVVSRPPWILDQGQ